MYSNRLGAVPTCNGQIIVFKSVGSTTFKFLRPKFEMEKKLATTKLHSNNRKQHPSRHFHRARRRASPVQHLHSLRRHDNRRNRLFALFPGQPSPRHAGRIHQYRRTEHRSECACYESDPAQLLSNIISNEQRYRAAPRPRPERTTILFTLGRDRDSKSESAASATARRRPQRRRCRPSPPRIYLQARPLNSYH